MMFEFNLCMGLISRPSPFVMLLDTLESPRWDLLGCSVGEVGGAASMDARPGYLGRQCLVRGLHVPIVVRSKPTCAGCASWPSPFVILLNILEPPRWDLPGCLAGVLRGPPPWLPQLDPSVWDLQPNCLRLHSLVRKVCGLVI